MVDYMVDYMVGRMVGRMVDEKPCQTRNMVELVD
jgi:hypothetical protein